MTTRWLPEHVAMLGTVPDDEVAAAVGCCRATVLHRRQELGIPAWTGSTAEREAEARLRAVLSRGPATAREVAHALGISHTSACRALRGLRGVRRSIEVTGQRGRPRYLWRLA